MSSLCVKFQTSSTPPSDRFWWGVLVLVLLVLVVVLLLLLVTGVKQSQLQVLRLILKFDPSKYSYLPTASCATLQFQALHDEGKEDARYIPPLRMTVRSFPL